MAMPQNTKELKQLISKCEADKQVLQIEIGKDRYDKVTKEISEVLERNGLNEFHAYSLINHLSDIYRLERTHV